MTIKKLIIQEIRDIAKNMNYNEFMKKIKEGNKYYEFLVEKFLEDFDTIELEILFKISNTVNSLSALIKFMKLKYKGIINRYVFKVDFDFSNIVDATINIKQEINNKFLIELIKSLLTEDEYHFAINYVKNIGKGNKGRDRIKFMRIKNKCKKKIKYFA